MAIGNIHLDPIRYDHYHSAWPMWRRGTLLRQAPSLSAKTPGPRHEVEGETLARQMTAKV